jgi:hypothetical protein
MRVIIRGSLNFRRVLKSWMNSWRARCPEDACIALWYIRVLVVIAVAADSQDNVAREFQGVFA